MTPEPIHFDPVCRKWIDPSRKQLLSEHNGTTYYFCTPDCRDLFIAAPERYIGVEKPRRKGFWRRYIDRIGKTTGGKPPCCH